MRRVLVFGLVFSAIALRASALPITYVAKLTGAAEFPANASTGIGFAKVTYDEAAHTMVVDVVFSNLVSNTTNAHIHCCVSPSAATPTVGVATTTPTFTAFPAGVTAGTYLRTFDLTLTSSWSSAFITNNGGTPGTAEIALRNGLNAGFAYLNIHTSVFQAGEIRGFLEPIPEPGTMTLVGSSLAALWLRRRKRQQ